MFSGINLLIRQNKARPLHSVKMHKSSDSKLMASQIERRRKSQSMKKPIKKLQWAYRKEATYERNFLRDKHSTR